MTWQFFFEHAPPYFLAIASFIGSYLLIKKGRVEVKSINSDIETKEADIAAKYQAMLLVEQNNSIKTQQEIKTMKDKIRLLENKLDEVQDMLEEYSAGVALLLAQLKVSGIIPIWKPKERNTTHKE